MLLWGAAAALHAQGANARAQPEDHWPDLAALQLRHIGPIGNRVPAVAGVPGDALTYYAGAASGGVFVTRDGGTTWKPTFDAQPVAAIGSITVAPSDPNVVWVGTGETFIRSNVMVGNGVYRSTDAGETWQHRGLERTGRIGRIAVHPSDPDTAFVAALGHAWSPQPERGLYRTRDGGETWEKVLFVDENTGAIDVLISAGNPRHLFAATWQLEMSTSGRTSGGPGSGLFRSRDGGDTWQRLGTDRSQGLPKPPWGKIGLAQSAAEPRRVWALIETSSNRDFAPVEGWDGPGFQGVLWRTDDGGDSWQLINRSNTLTQRPLYYTRAVAAPDDADEITFMAVQQSLSIDGGKTFEAQNSGWDHHDLWIDPHDGNRRIAGHDGGVSITRNRGKTWEKPQLPIAQLYHVNVDDAVPYNVYGNRQDGPSVRGPSRSRNASVIPLGAWQSVGGCEVGFAVPTPGAAHRVWAGCYDGILELFDEQTGQVRDVSVWPLAIESWAGADVPYRFQWNFPITISPHDADLVYVGSQFVHRTRDRGQTWQRISPDLTTADPELMRRSGGLTLDDAGPTIAPVVFSIAESPHREGEIWVGTNDGLLHVSRDAGATWTRLTERLPDLPPLGTVSSVFVSPHDADRVLVTIDRHQEGDDTPYAYVTGDGGETFRSLADDLPRGPLATVRCLIEDPQVTGLYFLGTNGGLFVSFDAGESWRSLRGEMPASPVSWLAIQERYSDLVVSTYGRGFWVLDDLMPLRWLARGQRDLETPSLLPVRSVFRQRSTPEVMMHPDSPAVGSNPSHPAFFHVLLPEASSDVERDLQLQVIDERGEVVRILDEWPDAPGLHRIGWNLRTERTPEITLRRPPAENPALPIDEERTLRDGGRFDRLVEPGRYRVELTAGGAVLGSESFEIWPDPAVQRDESSSLERTSLLTALEEAITRAARLVNGLEDLREQISQHQTWLRLGAVSEEREEDRAAPAASLPDDLAEADSTLARFEDRLFDLRLTPASQDSLRWQRRLYARLIYVARRVEMSDHRPTDAQRAVAQQLQGELDELEEEVRGWAEQALPRLRQQLADEVAAGTLLAPTLLLHLEPR